MASVNFSGSLKVGDLNFTQIKAPDVHLGGEISERQLVGSGFLFGPRGRGSGFRRGWCCWVGSFLAFNLFFTSEKIVITRDIKRIGQELKITLNFVGL